MGTVMAVPLEEYLTTSYEPDCEWVDGELREQSMPDEVHAAIQAFFMLFFGNRQKELNVRARAELRIRVAGGRFRLPDVVLLPGRAPLQAVTDTPPLLCIEILSPDDRVSELNEKISDYVAMGVGTIWIVDPRRRTLTAADGVGMRLVEVLVLPGTNVRLTGAEIFAELDELEAGTE